MSNTMTQTAPTGLAVTNALSFLNKAVSKVSDLGLTLRKEDEAPVDKLLARISQFGTDEAMIISSVLQHQSAFSGMVREQISSMEIASRQEEIVALFTSVRTDANKQLTIIDGGKVGFIGKTQLWWMDTTRGKIPTRFEKIRNTYKAVATDLGDQVEREGAIVEAYTDFRFALKEAEVQAYTLLETATKRLEETKQVLLSAQAAVDAFPADGSHVEKARLEQTRELARAAFEKMDEDFQISKDVADQLRVSYGASEFIFKSIDDTRKVKNRLFNQSTTFFATGESVLTGLAVKYTQNAGMHEATQVGKAMSDGINDMLTDLSNQGSKNLKEALSVGYGPMVRADSLRKFIDSVVEYQESSIQLVAEARRLSTDEANKIAQISEEGKRRYIAAVNKAAAA